MRDPSQVHNHRFAGKECPESPIGDCLRREFVPALANEALLRDEVRRLRAELDALASRHSEQVDQDKALCYRCGKRCGQGDAYCPDGAEHVFDPGDLAEEDE